MFESFFRVAEESRFPDLADRDQPWQLLLSMTVRKAIDHHGFAIEDPTGNLRSFSYFVDVE